MSIGRTNGRRLLVLIGTSVFQSATWVLNPQSNYQLPKSLLSRKSDFEWQGYGQWEKEGYLRSPSDRLTMCYPASDGRVCSGSQVRDWLNRVAEDHREDLAQQVAIDSESVRSYEMRYSAEIATLLRFRSTVEPGNDLYSFLQRYEMIELLHSQDEDSTLAAGLVRDTLCALVGQPDWSKVKSVASIHGDPEELFEQCNAVREHLFSTMNLGDVDVIASGGYKVFAMMAGFTLGEVRQRLTWASKHESALREHQRRMLERELQIIYLHEKTGGLVRHSGDGFSYKSDSRKLPSPDEICDRLGDRGL